MDPLLNDHVAFSFEPPTLYFTILVSVMLSWWYLMSKQEQQTEFLLAKYRTARDDGTFDECLRQWRDSHPHGPVRKLGWYKAAEQDVVFMQCNCCRCFKPLLPAYFAVDRDNFSSSLPGHESFNNSASLPCKLCYANKTAQARATIAASVDDLVQKYPHLGGADGFWRMWKRQGGSVETDEQGVVISFTPAASPVAGRPIIMTGHGRFARWSPSINNLVAGNTDPTKHQWKSCEICCLEENANQRGFLFVLSVAFRALIAESVRREMLLPGARAAENAAASRRIRENWSHRDRKELNGVTVRSCDNRQEYDSQCRENDVATICKDAVASHKAHDKDNGRIASTHQITMDEMAEMWFTVPECAHSGVLLEIANGFARVSLDRVGTGGAHELGSTVCCVSLLNTGNPWTKLMWLEYVLAQTEVQLKVPQRIKFEALLAVEMAKHHRGVVARAKAVGTLSADNPMTAVPLSAAAVYSAKEAILFESTDAQGADVWLGGFILGASFVQDGMRQYCIMPEESRVGKKMRWSVVRPEVLLRRPDAPLSSSSASAAASSSSSSNLPSSSSASRIALRLSATDDEMTFSSSSSSGNSSSHVRAALLICHIPRLFHNGLLDSSMIQCVCQTPGERGRSSSGRRALVCAGTRTRATAPSSGRGGAARGRHRRGGKARGRPRER